MKRLLRYMKGYRKDSVVAPLLKLFEATLELLVPFMMIQIIDIGIANSDRKYVLVSCLILALIALVGLCAAISAQYFSARAAIGFSSKLRYLLMEKIQKLSYTELDVLGSSGAITVMNSDVNQVQSGVNLTLRLLLRSPFVVFGALIAAYLIDPSSAHTFSVVIAILFVIVFLILLVSIPMHKKVQKSLDRITGKVRENLSGVRVIRAFCREDKEKKIFRERTHELTDMQNAVGRVSALLNPFTVVVINLGIVFLVYIGALRVESGSLTQGEVVALYNYMSLILVELVKFANLVISIAKALASATRVADLLDLPEEKDVEIESGDSSLERIEGIEFDNVSFRYEKAGDYSLENISFKVNRGETVGIIGSTGSGKSSLVNLIPRFYTATEGRILVFLREGTGKILVNGKDIREISALCLRSKIGIAPQKALLFSGTLRENLLWGDENADGESVEKALEAAVATEVVNSKTDKLDERVLFGGKNFSGGQRQRLTIARALVKKPDVLILDDSASALDYATDSKLRAQISSLDDKPITFIVSQRAASVLSADLIIVLDDGKAVGVGRHGDLLSDCEIYKEIYTSQFGGDDNA